MIMQNTTGSGGGGGPEEDPVFAALKEALRKADRQDLEAARVRYVLYASERVLLAMVAAGQMPTPENVEVAVRAAEGLLRRAAPQAFEQDEKGAKP